MPDSGNDSNKHPHLFTDANGVPYERKELNGHWVRYTFFDADGNKAKQIAMPRIEVFTADDIARFDRMFAAEDATAD